MKNRKVSQFGCYIPSQKESTSPHTCNSPSLLETIGKMKLVDFTTCKICDDSYHLQCLDPPLEFRPNSWKCPSCKERKIKYQKPEVKSSKPLFKGEHDDDCFMCFNGGDLLCCDYCEKAYHLSCHIPPLNAIPTGLWKCQGE